MSQFLSSRFLSHRRAARQTIDRDTFCQHCGYNLRGLAAGHTCPECGTRIEIGAGRPELLSSGESAHRGRWRAGLMLGAICLYIVILARWALLVGGVTGASDVLAYAYLATGLTVAVGWNIATWLVTPPQVNSLGPAMSMVRWAIRATQALWIVGMALWLIRYDSAAGSGLAIASIEMLQVGQLLCRAIAGVGALLLAWMLMHVAGHAWLEDAERRLNAALWGLPILTLLPQAFPAELAWFFLVPLGLLLIGWSWFMWLCARAMLEMHSHVRWAMIHRHAGRSRVARTEATRQALQREASQQVRPIPHRADDDQPIPLE